MDLYGGIDGVDIASSNLGASRPEAPQPPQIGQSSKGVPPPPPPPPPVAPSLLPPKKPGFSMAFKPRQTSVANKESVPVVTKKPPLLPITHSVASDLLDAPKIPNPPIPPIAPKSTNTSAVPPSPAPPSLQLDIGSFDVEDPYDPSQPNDYLKYCEERQERKRQRRIEQENQKLLLDRQREQERTERDRADALQRGDVQRLEQSMGGGRGRGVSNLPSWMANTTGTGG